MWKRLKQTIDELRRDKPGERFTRYYQRHRAHERESPWVGTFYMVLGWVLTIAGVVLTVLPVVPGFFLIFPGLAIVAVRSQWAARVLDRLEVLVA